MKVTLKYDEINEVVNKYANKNRIDLMGVQWEKQWAFAVEACAALMDNHGVRVAVEFVDESDYGDNDWREGKQ